jgi:hypothetical protein
MPNDEYIFLSYSRRDSSAQGRILAWLRGQGFSVWVDNEGLEVGTPIWEVEIEKAIRGSRAVIVLLSPSANDSEWVRREISYAERNHKRIFPALIAGTDESSVPLRLTNYQRANLMQDEEAGLERLAGSLRRYLEAEAAPGEEAGREAAQGEAHEQQEPGTQQSSPTEITAADAAWFIGLIIYFLLAGMEALADPEDLLVAISALLAGAVVLIKKQMPASRFFKISLSTFLLVYTLSKQFYYNDNPIVLAVIGIAALTSGVLLVLTFRSPKRPAFYASISFAVFLFSMGITLILNKLEYYPDPSLALIISGITVILVWLDL